jgi:hypothetical protein
MAKAEPRSITRRSMLAAFALPVIPALPLPPPDFAGAQSGLLASPAAPDPIFAAIEAHVRAYRAFIAVLDVLAVAETQAWHAPRGQRRAAKRRLAEAYAAERRFGDLEPGAFERLVATVPLTLSGAAAMLAYVREWLAEGHSVYDEEETITLLVSIEHASARRRDCRVPQAMQPGGSVDPGFRFASSGLRAAFRGAPSLTLRKRGGDAPERGLATLSSRPQADAPSYRAIHAFFRNRLTAPDCRA